MRGKNCCFNFFYNIIRVFWIKGNIFGFFVVLVINFFIKVDFMMVLIVLVGLRIVCFKFLLLRDIILIWLFLILCYNGDCIKFG